MILIIGIVFCDVHTLIKIDKINPELTQKKYIIKEKENNFHCQLHSQ